MSHDQSEALDIESKLKEAEVYFSMGLHEESLGVYVELASDTSEIEPQDMKIINDRIDLLKEKIAEKDKAEHKNMSSNHVEIVKQELSSPEGFDESLHSASALKELGLIEEAIAQYEKLLIPDCPPEVIVPELTQCLLTNLSPSKVIEQIDVLIKKKNPRKTRWTKIYGTQ